MTDRALQLAEEAKRLIDRLGFYSRQGCLDGDLRDTLTEAADRLAALSQGAPEGRAPDRAVAPQAVSVAPKWNRANFDGAAFYSALARAVESRDMTWKLLSAETGVSQTTLCRMKDGRCPDAASLAALSGWAGINPANYMLEATQPAPSRDSTPQASSNSGAEGQQAARSEPAASGKVVVDRTLCFQVPGPQACPGAKCLMKKAKIRFSTARDAHYQLPPA